MCKKIVSGRGSRFLFLSLFFLLGFSEISQLYGQGAGLEDRLITFEVKDRDVMEVINFIRQGTGVNIVVDEEVKARVSLSLTNVPWRQALDLAAERAGCIVIEMGVNLLKVEKPPVVHFAFDNADITKVIDAIAKVSGANIIVGPEVQGTVTVRLNNVPYRDALETIAKTLGFVVVQEKRGILRITDPTMLRAQIESRAFQLRYVRPPSTYTPYIKSAYVVGKPEKTSEDSRENFSLLQALEKTLSPYGRLDYIDRQNIIIVSDTKPSLDQIQKIIERIDVEPKQIFVDVKFVTTTNTDLFNFGIDYGSGGPTPGFSLSKIPIELPFNMGDGGFEDHIIVHNGDDMGPFTEEDFGTGKSPGSVNIPDIVFGALDFNTVAGTLNLLKSDTTSDIIQAPKIIALDHQPATVFVGERVPFAVAKSEQGQAGGLQLTVSEAARSPVSIGFQLLIIPHTVPGTDRIMLDIIPAQTSLTGSSTGVNAPPGFEIFTVGVGTTSGTIALPRIGVSTIATTLMLDSGHTAVLGGLSTLTKSRTVRGWPLLMDIPILGWFFKNDSMVDDRRNLIIFITPTLIRTVEESDRLLERELEKRQELYRSRFLELFPEILEGISLDSEQPLEAGAGDGEPGV